MTTTTRHWTERSIEDFAYGVASDFIDLIREEMDSLGWSKAKLAKTAKVSKGRITQIFKNPSNIEMITMVKLARALKMKMAVFPYRDNDDPNNERGPINSEVFRLCWENSGMPTDLWTIKSKTASTDAFSFSFLQKNLELRRYVYTTTVNNSPSKLTESVAPLRYQLTPGTKKTKSMLEVHYAGS